MFPTISTSNLFPIKEVHYDDFQSNEISREHCPIRHARGFASIRFRGCRSLAPFLSSVFRSSIPILNPFPPACQVLKIRNRHRHLSVLCNTLGNLPRQQKQRVTHLEQCDSFIISQVQVFCNTLATYSVMPSAPMIFIVDH